MFSEDDLLPISALQHLLFCERQWALIHLEGQWAENRLTVEGKQLHERADKAQTEVRGDLRIARAIALRSLRLGLTGRADVIEFHHAGEGAVLPGVEGRWQPFPVEYKRGRPKAELWDEVQLCAQALCIEEMLDVPVAAGALFYGETRRRTEVLFDRSLRERTEALAHRLHNLTAARRTPEAVYAKKCESCSLAEVCQPRLRRKGSTKNVERYLRHALRVDAGDAGAGESV